MTTVRLELEEQVSANIEGRVGKGVCLHTRVAVLPDALERSELANDLVDADRSREMCPEKRLRIGEHGGGRLVVDLSLLEVPVDGRTIDLGTANVELDAVRVRNDGEDSIPLGRGLRAVEHNMSMNC